jgi:hypothetical protein
MTESTVASVSTCRIERILSQGKDGRTHSAVFAVHKPEINCGQWIACQALIWPTMVQITVHTKYLNPSQAAALSTALQMAIDWIAEHSGGDRVA